MDYREKCEAPGHSVRALYVKNYKDYLARST